jgi:DNA repair protein RadC
MRVKDLPVGDRPRERLLERGLEALADRELLALLLGSGARGLDAVELAGQLIASAVLTTGGASFAVAHNHPPATPPRALLTVRRPLACGRPPTWSGCVSWTTWW